MNLPLLCLDFDGVICDSAVESFTSSWMAYFYEYRKEKLNKVSIKSKDSFLALRPFIRYGEDFLLIQEIISNNFHVKVQKDFDKISDVAGSFKLNQFSLLLKKQREKMISENMELWLSLNTIYSHMLEYLLMVMDNNFIHIVSTKDPLLIKKILKYNNINIPNNRIHNTGKNKKLDFIQDLLKLNNIKNAIFIDDQINHLGTNNIEEILVYLPAWGYIKPADINNKTGIQVLSKKEMTDIFKMYI